VFIAGIIITGVVLPLPAAPAGAVGVVDGAGMLLGVGLDAGVVPLMAAGVLPVIVLGTVGIAALPAMPLEGAGVIVPAGGGAVGAPTGSGVVPLSPQPASAAMTQSVESVANLVVMKSSKFELTHISPEAACLCEPADKR
jgi:hypothetical protein